MANLRLVLDQVADVPDERRGAAFVCAAALVLPTGEEHVVEGRLPGVLVRAPAGTGGFGYDPIFRPEGLDVTLAQLPAEEKNAISHRGRAFRAEARPFFLGTAPAPGALNPAAAALRSSAMRKTE